MDMLQVDPQLFIKCRLCLEEMGMFQIVPIVQSQIKFCFDIDVDSYDGLPQLICKSCQAILCEFFTIKKKYIDKQQNLKMNVKMKNDLADNVTKQAEQEEVNLSQKIDSEPDVQTQSSNLTKTKNLSVLSSSLESLHSDKTIITEKRDKHIPKLKKISWKTNFNKLITCRICQNTFKKKKHVIKHLQTHKKRFSKYEHILTNCCTVKLNKIDNKPNITGLENAVMYSQDKIIIDRGHVEFNIVYQSKKKTNNTEHIEQFVSEKKSEENVGDFSKCDSSEDDVVVMPKNHKNRNRLMSRSCSDDDSLNICNSTKTTVEINDTVCINLDDTSNDSATYKSNTDGELNSQINTLINATSIEKTVQSITASYSKYFKVKPNKQVSNESHLKHKILSLGRKILNKQGFGSTALLRYLENRNLEINWLPSLQNTKNAKETNYVRIFTKQREPTVNEVNCTGWKKVVYVDEHEIGNISARGEIDMEPDISENRSIELNSVENSAVNASSRVLAENKSDCESKLIKKILNKAPVSNPKQLRKKSNITESNSNTIIGMTEKMNSDCNIESVSINMEIDDASNNDICMPIILSTKSLALSKENCITNDNTCSSDTQRTEVDELTPKIKVKPVTELMSERALCNLNKNIWPTNHTTTLYTQNTVQSSQNTNFHVVQRPMSAEAGPQEPVTPVIATDYIILDCVQMPNTKTTSPINYMQTLLQMHGIILQTAELKRDFILLVKYKVVFKQEVLNEPKDIILCLSLFCKNNVYCFKVRDRHLTDIDLKKLTAPWEWEILKTLKGDVSKKLLENAEKVSPEVYKNTNIFLCLLKSVNVRMNF